MLVAVGLAKWRCEEEYNVTEIRMGRESPRDANERQRQDKTRQDDSDLESGGQREERLRFARFVHERIGSGLASLKLRLEQIAQGARPEDERVLQSLAADAARLLVATRSIVFETAPVTLWRHGIVAGLTHLVTRYNRDLGMKVHLRVNGDPSDLPAAIQEFLFDAAGELIRNARFHGEATSCNVSLVRSRVRVQLKVSDDGCGFDRDVALEESRTQSGIGLFWIGWWARASGGRMEIASAAGKGSEITVTISVCA